MSSSDSNSHLRLVMIESDRRARVYIKRAFSERGVRLIGEADELEDGLRMIRGLHPDVVLLEVPEGANETVAAVKAIREEQPNMGIILSKHNPSPELILSCMRAGAQEFVARPLDAHELEKAIDHVRKLKQRTVMAPARRGVVYSVFSGKGGIGCTTTAVNLAVALAENSAKKVVVVDLSFQMGDLSLMLDQPPQYSLIDSHYEGKLDDAKLRSVISQHDCGVHFLTVAASPEIGEEVTREHLVELFGALGSMYDFVVVDVGRQLDDRTAEVLELSDNIMLLSTLDVPTIRNVSRYLDVLDKLEFPRDKIHLVVNRFHKKTRLNLSDVESALGMDVFWTIPNDFEPVSMGIDGGTPAVLRAPRSKVARSFKQLAETICDEHARLHDEPPEENVNDAPPAEAPPDVPPDVPPVAQTDTPSESHPVPPADVRKNAVKRRQAAPEKEATTDGIPNWLLEIDGFESDSARANF